MIKKRRQGRLHLALLASAVVHAGVVALIWAAARNAEALPKMRVYAVDLVSPPPQIAGEPNPGAGGEPVVAEEVPEPVPEEPQPEPPPPEPEPPRPDPPAKEAPPKAQPRPPAKEPSPPAKATTKSTPAKSPPAKSPTPQPKQAAGGGTGGGTGASSGARPSAASRGGENLDVQLKGVQCPSENYCANIVRQLNRYFRPPAGSSSDVAEVFFWINRDGSVSDIRVVQSAGSFGFRVAAMEAVEQAGINKAFGALPAAFQLDRLPVSFYFRPAR